MEARGGLEGSGRTMMLRSRMSISRALVVACIALVHVSRFAHGASPIHVLKLQQAPERQVRFPLVATMLACGNRTTGDVAVEYVGGVWWSESHAEVAGGRYHRDWAATSRGAPGCSKRLHAS